MNIRATQTHTEHRNVVWASDLGMPPTAEIDEKILLAGPYIQRGNNKSLLSCIRRPCLLLSFFLSSNYLSIVNFIDNSIDETSFQESSVLLFIIHWWSNVITYDYLQIFRNIGMITAIIIVTWIFTQWSNIFKWKTGPSGQEDASKMDQYRTTMIFQAHIAVFWIARGTFSHTDGHTDEPTLL